MKYMMMMICVRISCSLDGTRLSREGELKHHSDKAFNSVETNIMQMKVNDSIQLLLSNEDSRGDQPKPHRKPESSKSNGSADLQ